MEELRNGSGDLVVDIVVQASSRAGSFLPPRILTSAALLRKMPACWRVPCCETEFRYCPIKWCGLLPRLTGHDRCAVGERQSEIVASLSCSVGQGLRRLHLRCAASMASAAWSSGRAGAAPHAFASGFGPPATLGGSHGSQLALELGKADEHRPLCCDGGRWRLAHPKKDLIANHARHDQHQCC